MIGYVTITLYIHWFLLISRWGVAFMLMHCNNDPSHLSHYDIILSTDICPGSVAVVQDGHGGAVLRVLDSIIDRDCYN